MWITSTKCQKMTVEERRRRRFSKEFRQEVVEMIEEGKMTVIEASRLYEVKSQNVRAWIKKYGKKEYPTPILVQSTKDIVRLRELEKENRRLKEVLGSQQMKVVYLEAVLTLAKEELGEDFEKKYDTRY
jgi:transposase